jgi:hypothetical protein
MTLEFRSEPDWPVVLRRYLAASAALHLAWETIQLPLYTIRTEPIAKQASAVLHCTLGDLMIAGLTLLTALAAIGTPGWPRSGTRAVWLLLLILGAGYTIYSEWLNISVRGSWAYTPLMPTLPLIGTGVAPLLQWIIVPTLVLRFAIGRWPWKQPENHSS